MEAAEVEQDADQGPAIR